MELEFHFDKEVITNALNSNHRVILKANDPDNEGYEFTLTARFPNGSYPPAWAKRLGRIRGDKVVVTFGPTQQQKTLEEPEA